MYEQFRCSCAAVAFVVCALSCKREPAPAAVPATPATPTATTAPSPRAPTPSPTAPAPNNAGCEPVLYSAPPGSDIRDLSQTAAELVWREHRGVFAMRKPSGEARPVLETVNPRALAVDARYAYVGQRGAQGDGVYRVPLAGGTAEFMCAYGGMFNLVDDLVMAGDRLIMSRGMGEIVRIDTAPPYAQRVYSGRDQRRNTFQPMAASEHAVWFARPGNRRNPGGYARLDLETGAVTPIAPPVQTIAAQGGTVVVVRGEPGLRAALDFNAQHAAIHFANEVSGEVDATPWWQGSLVFGVTVSDGEVFFRTNVDRPATGMPSDGWLRGRVGATARSFKRCRANENLGRAPLGGVRDGDRLYQIVNSLATGHQIVAITAE
jgi:hypothetical protein